MIRVDFTNEHDYPVDVNKVIASVTTIIERNHDSEASVSVAIVSDEELTAMAKKYLKESDKEAKGHPVLSFPTSELEGEFKMHKDEKNYLGEIAVSYEEAVKIANNSEKETIEAVCELAAHGAMHLVGLHHD